MSPWTHKRGYVVFAACLTLGCSEGAELPDVDTTGTALSIEDAEGCYSASADPCLACMTVQCCTVVFACGDDTVCRCWQAGVAGHFSDSDIEQECGPADPVFAAWTRCDAKVDRCPACLRAGDEAAERGAP
jgi:hypothetical protein